MASFVSWTRIHAKLDQLTWRRSHYLVRASIELVWARLLFERRSADAILSHLKDSRPRPASPAAKLCLQDLAWALAAAAARMPFRSDCLIQAMAAHRWLAAAGIESHFHLGVRKGPDGGLAAHAWLTARGAPVAGGDGRDFELLLPSAGARAADARHPGGSPSL